MSILVLRYRKPLVLMLAVAGVVVDGQVHVRGGEHGDEVLGNEHSIGMLSLLARDDKGLDAVAKTDTQMLALRADDLFSAFEDDFGILYNQIRDLAAQTLQMRRQASDGAYLGGTLSLPDDVPTGDLDVVQKLLFMRDGPLRSAPMDALITLAQQMRTARFEPRAGLGQIGARPGSCT